MKQFLLFGGDSIYSKRGGWSDFAGSFDTIQDAIRFVATSGKAWAWFQIADGETGENIENFEDYTPS